MSSRVADAVRDPARGDRPVSDGGALVEVEGLQVRFPVKDEGGAPWRRSEKRFVHAVQDVSFTLARGETLGLVGESGSGKSTIANAITRLVEPTDGRVLLDGVDVRGASRRHLKGLRRRMATVFQDPLASLDPRRTVADSVGDPLRIHGLHTKRYDARVSELLDSVGLSARFAGRYPHELSGGQRQRVCLARALACEPDLVILDEATASLDVSVQAQILNLLRELQDELGLAYLFISHDLAAVEYVSHRVLVLYLGRVMESAPRESLYREPAHPYTTSLMSAIPAEDPQAERTRERIILSGDLPSPLNPPSGCVFRTRCPIAAPECAQEVPPPVQVADRHEAACIRLEEAATLRR